MDVPLCGLFVFVVVFFVEWEWGVVGDGVPQVVFCESKRAHVFLWLWSVVQKWDLCH